MKLPPAILFILAILLLTLRLYVETSRNTRLLSQLHGCEGSQEQQIQFLKEQIEIQKCIQRALKSIHAGQAPISCANE